MSRDRVSCCTSSQRTCLAMWMPGPGYRKPQKSTRLTTCCGSCCCTFVPCPDAAHDPAPELAWTSNAENWRGMTRQVGDHGLQLLRDCTAKTHVSRSPV